MGIHFCLLFISWHFWVYAGNYLWRSPYIRRKRPSEMSGLWWTQTLPPPGCSESTNITARGQGLWHGHTPLSHVPLGISFWGCEKISDYCPLPSGLLILSSPPPNVHNHLLINLFMKWPTLHLETIMYSKHSFACVLYNLMASPSSWPGTDLALGHKIYQRLNFHRCGHQICSAFDKWEGQLQIKYG